MESKRKMARVALAAVLSIGAAPANSGTEPLIVTRLADPSDPNYLPPPSGVRNEDAPAYDDPVDQAVKNFSRAIGQAVLADRQAVQSRCRSGAPATASIADRWAWAAGCHYTRH
jgi:hypothetical protein